MLNSKMAMKIVYGLKNFVDHTLNISTVLNISTIFWETEILPHVLNFSTFFALWEKISQEISKVGIFE